MTTFSVIPKCLSELGLKVSFDGDQYTAIDSDGYELKTFESREATIEYLEELYFDYL